MKYKTTAKAIRNDSRASIAIGYCDACYLLQHRKAEAYTCGQYGWNFDVYRVENVYICTGYRGMVGIKADYDLVHRLNKEAKDASPERCEELLKELIETTLWK
jgi:hypothetical protein